jgi:diaminopimelate decarboxylase
VDLIDNRYSIQGVAVEEICAKYGTPLYVYDTERIKNRYAALNNAFKGIDVRFNYACKALSNIHILRFIKDLGAGLDTVSIQEVWLGLKAGFAPENILFTPNGVSVHEMDLAVEAGVQINIDNLSILEQFANKYGSTVPVCVRLNPHIMAGGNTKISTGHIDSKFGISVYQMRHLQRIVSAQQVKVVGLHMHTGSDILDVDVFLRGADILLEAAMDFPDLQYIDFGSGFKVAYKPDDLETDIQALGAKLSDRFTAFCTQYGRPLQILFEPGKFLVSDSGYFIAPVNVIKQTTSTVFAQIDAGFNHLLRPMFYDAYHHIENISNPGGTPRIYTVVGYICETDTFGWDRKISEVREGDLLCFRNAGAYGFSMASNYNSRFRPAEVWVKDGEAKLIRRRENFEDLLLTQEGLEEPVS